MKNINEFLFQLLVNLIVPLLFPSGAISLLVVFKEKLPVLLYDIFIWLFWLLIVIIIIRFIFNDTINKITNYISRQISLRKRNKLFLTWYNNFVSLGDIISDISTTTGDWKIPNDEQKREYIHLQTWFRDNRGKFIPFWGWFLRDRPGSSYRADKHELEYKIIHQKEDAFSCFYEPLSLDRLGVMMRHEFSTNDGDRIRYVLAKIQELTAELIEWEKSKR